MAKPEKATLDYLYFHPITKIHEFKSLRFNHSELKEKLDTQKLNLYLSLYQSKALNKRTKLFLTCHNNTES